MSFVWHHRGAMSYGSHIWAEGTGWGSGEGPSYRVKRISVEFRAYQHPKCRLIEPFLVLNSGYLGYIRSLVGGGGLGKGI